MDAIPSENRAELISALDSAIVQLFHRIIHITREVKEECDESIELFTLTVKELLVEEYTAFGEPHYYYQDKEIKDDRDTKNV